MGNGCCKMYQNKYFRARKLASESNEAVSSREGAAEALGISVSSLSDYELGITKVVPPDKVRDMALLYKCPELRNDYCVNDCPLGFGLNIATEATTIERAALGLIKSFRNSKDFKLLERLSDIAIEGSFSKITEDEMDEVLEILNGILYWITEIEILSEKAQKGKN